MTDSSDFPFELGPSGVFMGQYAIKEMVGSGGTARVYRALDVKSEFRVAVKVLLPRHDMDERTVNVFYDREFRAGRKLSHPNIAELLDAGRCEGVPYLVFEWLPRGLEDFLKANRPKWPRIVERYALPVIEALSYAHDQGVYHRDINLRNIRLSEEGVPKITDFGIATLVGDPPAGQTVADWRTAPFCPKREQDDPTMPGTRDVYSFGAVLLFAITGVDPLIAEYDSDRYRAIDDAKKALEVSAQLRGFISACLHNSPESRPRTATIALAQLRRIEAERAGGPRVTTYSFWMPPKARAQLQLLLGTEDTDSAVERVTEDLDGEVAVLLRHSDEPSEVWFELMGTRFRVVASIDREAQDRVVFHRVHEATYFHLEQARETAYRIHMRFVPGEPKDKTVGRNELRDLITAVQGHEEQRLLRERADERGKVLATWRRMLHVRSDIERFKEDPLEYTNVSVAGTELVFEMKEEPTYELVGQPRQVMTPQHRPIGGEVLDVRGNTVFVAHRYGDARELPKTGKLKLDMYLSRLALQRQEAALDVLSERRGARRDLVDLLVNPQLIREPTTVPDPTYRQPKLDAAKRTALRTALGSNDILAIHGPPGTGKTTFIAELVVQYRERHPGARILIASQTHAALDNVLERLQEIDDRIRLLRLARRGEVRVSTAVAPFLFDNQLAGWKQEVASRGREFIRSWAKARGIDVHQVEVAAQYEELAALREAAMALERDIAAITTDEKNYGENITTTKLELDRTELEEQQRENEETQRAALLRLTRMNAITAQKELDGLGPDDLRRRAAALVADASEAYRHCLDLLKLQAEWQARFGRGGEFTAALISRSEVVAATCVGLPGFRGAELVEFDLCIIDEASKATPTEALIPMVQARSWVVVGDPNQLPPYLETAALKEIRPEAYGLTETEMRRTLLDHLLEHLPQHSRWLLSEQHRMVAPIGTLVSECFYHGELTNAPVEPIHWLSRVFDRYVTWFTTSGRPGSREVQIGWSFSNQEEERVIRGVLSQLQTWARAAGHRSKSGKLSVGVVAAYRAQRDRLSRELYAAQVAWDELDIEFGTVDAFQGREKDVLLYSVTRSNTRGELGFLREPARLNVALSRGRKALAIVGDLAFVKGANDPSGSFQAVVKHIESHSDECAVTVWDGSR